MLADRAALPYRAGWAAKVANAMEAGTVPARSARNFLAGVQAERVRPPSVAGWRTSWMSKVSKPCRRQFELTRTQPSRRESRARQLTRR